MRQRSISRPPFEFLAVVLVQMPGTFAFHAAKLTALLSHYGCTGGILVTLEH